MNITAAQITEIANALGAAAAVFVPGSAAVIAAAEGLIVLIDNTLLPLIQSFEGEEATVAEQALVAARTVANEKRFGAPPAPHN
jgi:hypothetical protein